METDGDGEEDEDEDEFEGIRERFEALTEVQSERSVKKLRDDPLWGSASKRLGCGWADFEKSFTMLVGREDLRKLDTWRK